MSIIMRYGNARVAYDPKSNPRYTVQERVLPFVWITIHRCITESQAEVLCAKLAHGQRCIMEAFA